MITVAATTAGGATGYARRTVVSRVRPRHHGARRRPTRPATTTGPGTFAYPTSGNFKPGAFDLERFQVIVAGDNAAPAVRTRDLTPTFGTPLGAQLVDVYVHTPPRRRPRPRRRSRAATTRSRRLGLDPADRGAGLRQPGLRRRRRHSRSAPCRCRPARRRGYITIIVPLAALGTPARAGSSRSCCTGQDGFTPDQARGFQPTPQDFQFGSVRAASGRSPICGVDPGTAPKAMDVLTPAGVDQADELDPTQGPVRIAGVAVP